MTEIAGSRFVITGGASGMGRCLARKAAAAGADLVLWDLDRLGLEKLVAELTDTSGRSVHGYVCDVSDREQVYETARRTLAEAGPVDVLVNNAGVVSGARLLDLPDEEVERTFRVNTLALFWTAKAFLPAMVERNGGHLVTMASASSYLGVAKLSDYAASKWAAMGFDESLRVELARTAPGVVTTVVCPFYVNTGMFDGVKSRFPLLLPILDEDVVADRVLDAIRRDRRRLVLPPLVALVPLLRVLPVRWLDAIAGALGVNVSMDEFVGRQGRR